MRCVTNWMAVFFVLLACLIGCTNEPISTNASAQKLRVVAVFATPIEEPWDGAIHTALLRAEKELDVDYQHTDNVQANEFEKVLRKYAEQNVDILIGDAFAAEDTVRLVAKEYPKTAFVFGSGLGPADPNLSVFDNWIHEPAYLAGMIAGRLTKSNLIGVVGGYPIPEVNRLINAFAAGAKEVNPDSKLKVTFIGSWFDPPKAKQAAHAMIDQGVDVMYAERAGVIEACEENKVPVFGNIVDQRTVAKDVVVTSVLWDMWPTVSRVIESVRKGSYTAENYAGWSMMGKGGSDLASFGEWEKKLDKSVLELVEKRKSEIRSGKFRVPVIESQPVSE